MTPTEKEVKFDTAKTFFGKSVDGMQYANLMYRQIQLVLLWFLSAAAFTCGLIALFSTSWRFSMTNSRAPSLSGYPTQASIYRRYGQHGIWTVCEYSEKLEQTVWEPDIQEICYPLEYRFADQVSYFGRALFIISIICQACMFLILAGSIFFCCKNASGRKCYAEDSVAIQVTLLCANISCLVCLIVAVVLFLGKSTGNSNERVTYSLTSKSTGAMLCGLSFVASSLSALMLGYMLKFERAKKMELNFVTRLDDLADLHTKRAAIAQKAARAAGKHTKIEIISEDLVAPAKEELRKCRELGYELEELEIISE